MIGGNTMYAPKSQKGIRRAMISLDGDIGRRVFAEIRSTKFTSTSKRSAAKARQIIKAAEEKC